MYINIILEYCYSNNAISLHPACILFTASTAQTTDRSQSLGDRYNKHVRNVAAMMAVIRTSVRLKIFQVINSFILIECFLSKGILVFQKYIIDLHKGYFLSLNDPCIISY